ncbi:MAG: excinuclease ABC subunit UvrA [Thermodesulfovibrionales bacterium]|nr:excinuclease ABC subunit UvrA [Thermodesulfovibrionales bacterium]
MALNQLLIEGARQNNLKNISLSIPHNKIIAITGVSGSGKSSLAFDTIFAEGQWRYIESLSTYARLFLEKMDRPDVDAIYNIRPAISLEQKNPIKGSRSTVGTLTEIYDLLRLLYSRISTPFCPRCHAEIKRWSPEMIIDFLRANFQGKKAVILFTSKESLKTLTYEGFSRIFLDEEVREISELSDDLEGDKQVVLDRLIIKEDMRLSDSIETAWKLGRESLTVLIYKDNDESFLSHKYCQRKDSGFFINLSFNSQNSCDMCGYSLPEPTPILFSFNHPLCACPNCNGFGNILLYDEDLIFPDKQLSLNDGALEIWEIPTHRWWKKQLLKGLQKSNIDIFKPFEKLSKEEKDLLFKGNEHFYGIDDFFKELESKRYKLHVRVFLSRYRKAVVCPVCKGTRLCEDALAFKIDGLNISEVSEMSVSKIIRWFQTLQLSSSKWQIAGEVIKQIQQKLNFLEKVGLGYLTLSRQAKTLSGGEYQRVNLSNQLASALTSTLYVLDEPTIGLHPKDTMKIIEIIKQLSAIGNTIIVVEHDKEMISNSDWVVELGPDGGHLGGEVIFNGKIEDFLCSETITSNYIKDDSFIKIDRKVPIFRDNFIYLKGAKGNNLKNISIKIPVNCLTVVTGVSGSGKSSLIVETLYRAMARHFKIESETALPYSSIEGYEKVRGVRLLDQSPLSRTPRSNALTFLEIFSPIRKLFASQPEAVKLKLTQGAFSFNIPGGRCESCKGEGYKKVEMYFFEDMYVRCEDCKGRRYKNEILQVTYKGRNIYDVLEMTVSEALVFFGRHNDITSKMEILNEVGLGYLKLGQPISTLSGGELQRLKICAELQGMKKSSYSNKGKGLLYIMDEPTIGLHYRDVMMFMSLIDKLISKKNTVVIIEHNLDVISRADWVIDLGPEGGEEGGELLFEGTPESLIEIERSYTGNFLRRYYGNS